MNTAPRHGGNLQTIMANFGGTAADWIDCSSGIAPYSYPLPAIPLEFVHRLPAVSTDFLAAASRYYGSAQFLALAGSQAAIATLPLLRRTGKVGVLRASYAEHAWRWQQAGHTVVALNADEIDYAVDHVDVLIIVNPNNPDGTQWSRDALLGWHKQLAARGGWLIVDEAFIDCLPDNAITQSLCADATQDGLLVLRSLGKFFGLAGVRLGFVFASQDVLQALAAQLGPWSVSGPALWAGELALHDVDWQLQQRTRLLADQQWFASTLQTVGLPARNQHPLMLFCPVKNMDQWGYALACNKIYARPFNTHDIGLEAIRFGAVHYAQRDEFSRRLQAAAQQVEP